MLSQDVHAVHGIALQRVFDIARAVWGCLEDHTGLSPALLGRIAFAVGVLLQSGELLQCCRLQTCPALGLPAGTILCVLDDQYQSTAGLLLAEVLVCRHCRLRLSAQRSWKVLLYSI